jgi:hypothetical protein
LRATTEPARIINNDAPAPVGNIADNNKDDEQLIDAAYVENVGNPANNNDAAPVGNVGNHANNNDPPNVVDEQSNDAAAPIRNIADSIDNNDQRINVEAALVRNITDSIDNNEQLNDWVNNDHREVADGQLIEAVVGNGNIETIMWPSTTMELH